MTFKVHFVLWCIFFFKNVLPADSIYTKDEGSIISGHKVVYHGNSLHTKDVTVTITVTPSLLDYVEMIAALPTNEQLELLVKNIPENVDEALNLIVREILLYQKIFLEQIKAIEAMKAHPSEHVLLALHFQKFKFEPWIVYREAKLQVAWCNTLIRYAGWITRNPDKLKERNIHRLYEILFTLYQTTLKNAEVGLESILKHFKGRYSPAYALILFKCREVSIRPSNIRVTVWFHDHLTPALLFYSTAAHLLMPFIPEAALKVFFQRPEKDFGFGKEFCTLNDVGRFKIATKSRRLPEPSLKVIANAWTELGKLDAYQVTRDWRDETVTDWAFEKSFMDPLELKSSGRDQNISKTNYPNSKSLSKGSKGKKASKMKQKKKVTIEKHNDQTIHPDEISPSTIDVERTMLEAETIKLENSQSKAALESMIFACDENLENDFKCGESSKPLYTVDDSSQKEIVSLSSSSSFSSETESEEIESCNIQEDELEEDWELQVKRDSEARKQYALKNKVYNRARKVISQEENDRIESGHRLRIFTRFGALSSYQPTSVIRLDSTELCLAYPDSYSLFLSNKNICSAKAKKYQWFFDANVTIKQKHMNFLCVLFGLESGKSRLTFESMAKAFWAIEKCFYGEQTIKDVKRHNFEWSHRFEINNVLVTPIKKDVHPEHKSSRFNHSEALALFNSGGFDPRFFTPLE